MGVSRSFSLACAIAASVAFSAPAGAQDDFFSTPARDQDAPAPNDPLASWNDGAAKQAIVKFVSEVTKRDAPDFVKPAERIAVFDNDGTLWAEQPVYFQVAFALDRVKALAPAHPEWKDKEPFKTLLAGDVKGALGQGQKAIVEILAATHAGLTTDEFAKAVAEWTATAKHPRSGRLYTEMVYQPMLELVSMLRAYGFKTYIVSGGGVEFMRAWAEGVYGIPPEQVVGSSAIVKYELRPSGPVLLKEPKVEFVDDGPGKPVGINRVIGRRPVLAFGNSDGDHQMLQWTAAGPGRRLVGLVHHTDGEREWAYDRQSHIGKLDKALDEALAKGWTVVDMKRDWKRIFAFEQ
jgi:phosphoserine phosphatase